MAILFRGYEFNASSPHFHAPEIVAAERRRRFEIGERIAAGGNGVVHKCTDLDDGAEYAIKFLLDNGGDRAARFEREIGLLAELQHDYLVGYQGRGVTSATKVRGSGRQVQRSACELQFVIMALATSSLTQGVSAGPIEPEVYFPQFRGLSQALGKLHSRAIHRDIKPDNILVLGDRWVLSDYGLCDLVEQEDGARLTPDWRIPGPRFWMSPEANNRSIGHTQPISKASDVFQLASVFWFVVNRTHPTGVLRRSDWHGPDALFYPIYDALHYDVSIRPANGDVFSYRIAQAIEKHASGKSAFVRPINWLRNFANRMT